MNVLKIQRNKHSL